MNADPALTGQLLQLLSRLSYRKGTFRLASGKTSDFYVDVKQTVYTAAGSALVGRMICDLLAIRSIELVGGMALGAIPLVDAALNEAARRGWTTEGFFVRKDVKDHGTSAKLDGRFDRAKRIAILEDVVTTGESTIRAIDAVEQAGGEVACVIVVVDREEDDGIGNIARRCGDVVALATKTGIRRASGEF
jgi:orotate phosphoribosyltransferase